VQSVRYRIRRVLPTKLCILDDLATRIKMNLEMVHLDPSVQTILNGFSSTGLCGGLADNDPVVRRRTKSEVRHVWTQHVLCVRKALKYLQTPFAPTPRTCNCNLLDVGDAFEYGDGHLIDAWRVKGEILNRWKVKFWKRERLVGIAAYVTECKDAHVWGRE
jgi:hypothetical protein